MKLYIIGDFIMDIDLMVVNGKKVKVFEIFVYVL